MALAVDESKDKANWRDETNQPLYQTVKVYYMGKRGGQQEGGHLLLVRGRETNLLGQMESGHPKQDL